MSRMLRLPRRSATLALLFLLSFTSFFCIIECDESAGGQQKSPAVGITAPLVFPSDSDGEHGFLTPLAAAPVPSGNGREAQGQDISGKPPAGRRGPLIEASTTDDPGAPRGEEQHRNDNRSAPIEQKPSTSSGGDVSTSSTVAPQSTVAPHPRKTTPSHRWSAGGGSDHWHHDHPSGRGGPLPFTQSPKTASVMAAIFVGVAICGYLALVCWRRSLERKYGNRELLVSEEEASESDFGNHAV